MAIIVLNSIEEVEQCMPLDGSQPCIIIDFSAGNTVYRFDDSAAGREGVEEWLSQKRGNNYLVLRASRVGVKVKAVIIHER